jgi:hypothetical protein
VLGIFVGCFNVQINIHVYTKAIVLFLDTQTYSIRTALHELLNISVHKPFQLIKFIAQGLQSCRRVLIQSFRCITDTRDIHLFRSEPPDISNVPVVQGACDEYVVLDAPVWQDSGISMSIVSC